MPCDCLGGGKKRQRKDAHNDALDDGRPMGPVAPARSKGSKTYADAEDGRAAKRRDVLPVHEKEQDCALLTYKNTSSPPAAHPRTPTPTPSSVSALSAGALCRAELADKRREFFHDLYDELESTSVPVTRPNGHAVGHDPSLEALATMDRARAFGDVQSQRPHSTHEDNQDIPSAPPLLPGPHLLHPCPSVAPYPPAEDDGGFTSPDFVRELRKASDEMARRRACSDDDDDEDERGASPAFERTKRANGDEKPSSDAKDH